MGLFQNSPKLTLLTILFVDKYSLYIAEKSIFQLVLATFREQAS